MNEARAAALLLALAAGACSSDRGPAANAPSIPDQIIVDFTMDNFAQNTREWKLESPKAYVYEKENRVEVEQPHIRFYDNGRPGATMDAGRGRFFTDSRSLRAWDGVVMVSTDGARVESPWMDYNAKADLVTSTAAVTVTRQRSVLRGVGWQAKPDLSKVVVRNQTLEYVGPAPERKR